MPTKEAIQALIDTRQQRLKEASEKRDVDELMTWYAKDATFKDAGTVKAGAPILDLVFNTAN